MRNPLFPIDPNESADQPEPLSPDAERPPSEGEKTGQKNPAVELIRQKLDSLYDEGPGAKEELGEAEAASPRSKHQEFMYRLSTSGKSLADIQTEWHNYYVNLPDNEKHEVWQEFYVSSASASSYSRHAEQQKSRSPSQQAAVATAHKAKLPSKWRPPSDRRSAGEIKQQILDKVNAGGQLTPKHHLQSLLFGLGMGALVLFIFLFTFFNQVIISPFIHPGSASATPIIVGPDSVAPNGRDEVIIPKINVEIPVDYSQTTTDEAQIENALEAGVVHYPTTELPGQKGNSAFFGHSSNNIFNPGKYKFAFVLLHTLVPGDTFYLTKDHKLYVYKVISRKIVEPSDVSVLNDVPGQVATATLITCDPPGTSLHRLIVVGQQISPSPTGNTAASPSTSYTNPSSSSPANLPGNGPSLFSRLWHSVF